VYLYLKEPSSNNITNKYRKRIIGGLTEIYFIHICRTTSQFEEAVTEVDIKQFITTRQRKKTNKNTKKINQKINKNIEKEMTENSNSNNSAYLKFLAPLGTFSGVNGDAKAEAWLKSVKRVKTVSHMDDAAALIVAASNMVGKAQVWWDSIEDSTTTWVDFEAKFNKKFLKNRVAEAWGEIKVIKQSESQEVGDFIEKLNGLFKVVNLTDDESKMSFFIASVNSSIAYELERVKSNGARTYESITEEAIEIEKLQKKYKLRGIVNNGFNKHVTDKRVTFETVQDSSNNQTGSVTSARTTTGSNDERLSVDSLASLIEAVNLLNINMVQQQQQMTSLQQQQQQQQRSSYQQPGVSNNYSSFNRPPYGGRPLQCWNCGQEGHPSRFCTNSGRNSNNAVMDGGNVSGASGSGPGGSSSSGSNSNGNNTNMMGKENGRQ
jgi:hypothetical protein